MPVRGRVPLPTSCSQASTAPTRPLLLKEPKDRTFCELLVDCEEDCVLRAVLVGMPREAEG